MTHTVDLVALSPTPSSKTAFTHMIIFCEEKSMLLENEKYVFSNFLQNFLSQMLSS